MPQSVPPVLVQLPFTLKNSVVPIEFKNAITRTEANDPSNSNSALTSNSLSYSKPNSEENIISIPLNKIFEYSEYLQKRDMKKQK